jgi:dihydrofolate synthase/folylpolyglutamate synthase
MRPRSLSEWLEYIDRVHPRDIEMGLSRVSAVAHAMGLLPVAVPTLIVAGTNGKGSTCVATEATLIQLGWRVGTTLSPHISHFRERIRIDSQHCSDAMLCDGFARIEAARGDTLLTYFEFSALLALYCFRAQAVDVAILEVGLGGRLDAFNIVDADVAVITSIGLDHTEYLGADIEQIGIEKAGVLRRGQQVVLGPDVTQSVVDRAASLRCDVRHFGKDVVALADRTRDHWRYRDTDREIGELPRGSLALQNCALGIQAALLVHAGRHESAESTLRRVPAAVAAAMATAQLPGRMEKISVGARDFLLDVAHNPAAAPR